MPVHPLSHLHPSNYVPAAVFSFGELPAELRQMIWDEALEQELTARVVPLVGYEALEVEMRRLTETKGEPRKPWAVLPIPILCSPLLSVNLESRTRATKFYANRITIAEQPRLFPEGARTKHTGVIYLHLSRELYAMDVPWYQGTWRPEMLVNLLAFVSGRKMQDIPEASYHTAWSYGSDRLEGIYGVNYTAESISSGYNFYLCHKRIQTKLYCIGDEQYPPSKPHT
ncbi:putative 2EXR domain-containing protein [Seiridium unicorne]|uniref:2EXR domain-containing protein n=1 Tax=Seiridium unicorne TaxID=138068 RepID=A0ABR2V2R4_9PEZI